jgi:glycosyltransferase involved in cell wall biosynthesis
MGVRVLHLVHWLNRGGIENWLVDFLRASDRNELEMDVVCRGPHPGELAPLAEQTGAKVHLLTMGLNPISFGRRLARLIEEQRYQVLHVHAGSFVGYPCQVGKRAGAATVSSYHNTHFPFEVRGIRSLLAGARAAYTKRSFRVACDVSDAVTACSQATMDAITKLAGVTPDSRYSVIPYGSGKTPGINPATRATVRAELGIGPDTPLAIHTGVMRDQKNHVGLLRIADRIRQAIPDFRLILAGDGALRPAIESQIRDLKLEQTVTLLGMRSDVERLLEASDLFIFPSLWEGLPVAVLEAQMKGLAVVGSDIGPLIEATAPIQRELLFPVDQETQMADAAIALLRNEARRASLAASLSQYAIDHFSIAANLRRHLELYRSITA